MGKTTTYQLTKPVFLIGFMGSGKSSVARCLACDGGMASCDLDELIEQRDGRTIAQIFEDDGQEGFRDLESDEISAVAQGEPRIIACGGGVVERPANVDVMHAAGYVVCLNVDFDEAARRIGADTARPLFAAKPAARTLFQAREKLYRQAADVVIDTTASAVDGVAAKVRAALVRDGILHVPSL